jgi:hypothetical protein
MLTVHPVNHKLLYDICTEIDSKLSQQILGGVSTVDGSQGNLFQIRTSDNKVQPFLQFRTKKFFPLRVCGSLAPSKPRVVTADEGNDEITSCYWKTVRSIFSRWSRMLSGVNERPDTRPLGRMRGKVVAKVKAREIEVTANILM